MQGVSQKAQEHRLERLKCIEDELVKLRTEVISLRSERDKSALEAQFAQGKLDRFLKEFEHLREEHNAVLSRNVEFSQLIVDYQKKLRENSESCTAAEELSRKLKMEVSILKHEKEILVRSEKRASDEVRSLSERVHRLQASLDTIQSTEEVREEARGAERRKQEEYIKHIEKEWAEAKKELQEERNNVRNLTLVRENDLKSALRQVEEMGKELANSLHSLSMVESRAAVAEARAAGLEEKLQSSHTKISDIDGGSGPSSSSSEIVADLCTAQEEIKNLREEVKFCKDHMLQANEEALKQMEQAHENFKVEADNMKNSLEEEILLLRKRAKELEGECDLRTKEAASANAGKDEELAAAFSEIAHLKEDCCLKMSQIGVMEIQISSFKDDLEKEHQRWQAAQANYERQVILQSETIQELTRTSQALASLQEETSKLHKMSDALKSENIELKAKWDAEKKELEELKSEADKKFNEVNEQNKILLSRLEAIHIKQAEKDRVSAGISSGTTATEIDDGLLNVVNYLRRSKEIAETEISLLKQERLRLQSQLENALKAAETAEASYRAERDNSKALLYREEEFKGLQLQVRELNLLRESNLQLREENKHNFEECQKLRETAQKARSEADDLEKFLKDREHEVEAFRKEADIQRMEKQHLEKRIDELVEKCKSFDMEDYERVREAVRQMQETLKEKDDQLEEIRKHVSERQELISKLEQDLARNRVELSQRESRINELLQAEATLRSELDKMKRSTNLQKKKFENLVKEKDELNKENQVLLKNLEEARQGRRNVGDAITEQALKEKEKEKDTRIQMLEKTLERHREELKREKEEHRTEKARRLKTQRTCTESIETVKQQQSKLLDELEKHKQALKMFTDEGEKSRQPKGGQSEGTSVDLLLAGTRLADFTAAYLQAVNNFEQVVQPICIEAGVSTAADISSGPEISLSSGPAVSLVLPTSSTKTEDEREKRLVSSKMSSETRKTGRKLVRPRILKPEELHDDIEMQEVDATASSGKPLASHAVETQENPMPTSQPSVRKRPSATSTSELQEETPTSEEASTHMQPVLKKPKGPETSQEGGEVKSVVNLVPESVLATEEYDVGDLTQGFKEEDDEKDEAGSAGEQGEDVSVDAINHANLQNDRSDVVDDILDRSGETAIQDDQLNFQVQQDIHQTAIESGSEKEEGELVADITDIEGGSNLSMGSPDVEGQSEQTVTPENLTGVDEDPFINMASETGEVDSSRVLDDEKTDGGEELVEVQDKMNDGSDRVMAETDQVPESVPTTSEKPSTSNNPVADLKEENPGIATDTEEATQSTVTSRSSTTINLMERARERARERQGQHTTLAHPSAPTRARGRLLRGRQVRGGRSGRGQTPG